MRGAVSVQPTSRRTVDFIVGVRTWPGQRKRGHALPLPACRYALRLRGSWDPCQAGVRL
jgi:hypothetical protein